MTEQRAKYTEDEIAALGELKTAIRSVVRGPATDDEERLRLIARASELKHDGLLPENWSADGALKEKRETANDVFVALDGALADAYDDPDEYPWYIWVQDWDGGADGESYRVIYSRGDDLYAAPFSWTDDNTVVVDVDAATKVRPITTYVDRSKQRNHALPSNPRIDSELREARDGMRGEREVRQTPGGFEMREIPKDDGEGNWVICSGCASATCTDFNDDSNAYEMEDAFGPWVESTVRGFAVKTIREGCDTSLLVNHTGVNMARTKAGTLDLHERLNGSSGLFYEGKLNPTRPDVQILRAAVQDKAIDESSFAFRVMRQKWSDDYTRRWIQEISLHKGDVCPVNYGASERTADHPLSMRSAMAVLGTRGVSFGAFAAAMKELRSGSAVSQTTLDLLEVFDSMDSEQRKLAEMLGLSSEPTEPEEPESEARSAAVIPLILPDYTTRAKAELAAMRR